MLLLLGLCLTLIRATEASYACVCNNKALLSVYPSKSSSVSASGSLNYAECKEFLPPYSDGNWFALAYQHKVVYVENSPSVLLDMCTGAPSKNDAVTSSQVTGSGSTTSSHIQSTTKQPTPSTTTTTTTTTTTMSTTSPTTTTTTTATTTHRPSPNGDVSKCASSILTYGRQHNDPVGQFGQKCYLFLINKPEAAWHHAEDICQDHGGHLVHIENANEQKFVTDFVKRHSHNAIWIGLHDEAREGHFTWTSGGASTYFNWDHDRFDTHGGDRADCILLDPSRNGLWNDVMCGSHFFNHDYVHTEKVMCQISINGNVGIVG